MAENHVAAIQNLFNRANSNSSNHIGIKYRVKKDKNGKYIFDDIDTKLCSFTCLNCGTILNTLTEFIESGPKNDVHPWFCTECLSQYTSNIEKMHSLDPNNYIGNYLRAHKSISEYKKTFVDKIKMKQIDANYGVEIWIYFG
jgi:hypothetical protein